MAPKKLIEWFDKITAVWRGTCSKCGQVYTHRGTQPTQTTCNKKDCNGTIMWQIDQL